VIEVSTSLLATRQKVTRSNPEIALNASNLGQKFGVALSHATLLAVLQRMDRSNLTAHGFRSTFRDWAAEATHHPNHVIEQALAHVIPSAVEAAYRRGDLFEKRKRLMNDWAAYLAKPPARWCGLRSVIGWRLHDALH